MIRRNQKGANAVSYAGSPQDNSILYLGKKFADLVVNLEEVQGCLIFFEEGMQIPASVLENNECHFSAVPVRDFALSVREVWEREQAELDQLPRFNRDGALIGSETDLADDVIIEPGAFVDHRVKIDSGTRVCTGAVIRHGTRIGRNCLIREGAVIGSEGFTMAPSPQGEPFRLHCLAGVELEEGVEVGANTSIARGQARNTLIGSHSKIDDRCYLAHDVMLGKLVTLTAGVSLGGFVEIGDGAYLGMNSSVKQLLSVGEKSVVGMGSVVTKSVPQAVTVLGVPARIR